MKKIPTNNNLNETINQVISSIQQVNEGYVQIVDVVNSSVKNMSLQAAKSPATDTAGFKHLENIITGYDNLLTVIHTSIENLSKKSLDNISLEYFKNINEITTSYMSIIIYTLQSLSQTAPNNDITKLLGYVEYGRKEAILSGTTPKSKYAVIDGLIQMGQVFASINKLIEGIVKTDIKSFRKAEKNITLFSRNVRDIVTVLVNSISSMSSSLNAEEIKALMGDEMTEKILEYNDILKTDKTYNKEGVLTSEKQDALLKKQSERTSKNYGIFDVFEKFLVIVSSIANFQSPSLTKTFIELKKTDVVLKMFISSFIQIIDNFNSKSLSKDKLENINDRIDYITSTIDSVKDIFENISVIGSPKYIPLIIIAKKNINLFSWFLSILINFIRNINTGTLSSIDSKTKQIINSLNNIKRIVDELTSIAKNMTLMSVLFAPAIAGLIGGSLFVLILWVFIQSLRTLTTVFNKADFVEMSNQLSSIRRIIEQLILIESTLVLLSVISILFIVTYPILVASLLLLITTLLLIKLVLLVMEKVNKKSLRTKLLLMSTLLVISAILLIITELVVLSRISKLVDWEGLFIGLGLFIGALVLLVVIGLLITMSSGIILIAAALSAIVTVAALVVITSIITISLELLLFSKLDLSSLFVKNDKGQTIIEYNMVNIINAMKTVSNTIWSAYSDGAGIIKTAIVAIWLIVNIFTIGALVIISGLLYLFNKIAGKLDEKQVNESINKILYLSRHIVDVAIGGEGVYTSEGERKTPNPEDSSFIDKLISIGGGFLEIAKSLLAFVNLATVALSVAVLWGIAAMLNKIATFDLKENDILPKVNQIILCANSVAQSVMSGGNAKTVEEAKNESAWEKAGRFIKGGVKAIGGAIGNVASAGILSTALVAVSELETVSSMLTKIAEFKIDEKDIISKTNQIIRIASQVSTTVTSTTNTIPTIERSKVNSFGTYVDDSIKLMKQINKLDTDKLVKYSDMWVKMTEFMAEIKNLNIEELSDAIVNKIAPAMEGISDNVDKIGTNTSKEVSVATNPATTVPNTVQPTDQTTILPPEKPKDYTEILQSIKNLLEEYLEV